ncbi:MAG: pyridoxamine 5'-phosphate oxidase family protein [Desulfobacterota bacterium]|nr:pyridoxamine 5'-phosphate oxidase family protein [Thermodesulfobacteriota bacterium]
MKLSEYFEKTQGRGVIATADADGKVGMAIYGRPHFISERTVAFIMADRLMHKNLQSNPKAAYLFMEDKPGYVGKRLYLTKLKEEKDTVLIEQIRRKDPCPAYTVYKDRTKYLVYFRIDKVLPLIGDKK